MRIIPFLLHEPVVLLLGWALVHFLWEGTVVVFTAYLPVPEPGSLGLLPFGLNQL